MKTRSYEGLHDLHAMLDLLSEGCTAGNGSHYVHRGDLQWWLFYSDIPENVWRSHIRLWEDERQLVAWVLLSPDERAFDVFVLPHLRGSSQEEEMLCWAVDQMVDVKDLQNVWVSPQDDARIQWLEANGFKQDDFSMIHFKRSLSGALDMPPLPEGFSIRTSRGAEDARLRSRCSYGAFVSTRAFDAYWPRTERFMNSPVYVPEHEIFVIAPGGEVASFCIIWTDEKTKVGHFEPVGTHPAFQRKGLGRCLMFDAMRRLQEEGMDAADLCTNYNNESAIPLYESVGFHKADHLLTYVKRN